MTVPDEMKLCIFNYIDENKVREHFSVYPWTFLKGGGPCFVSRITLEVRVSMARVICSPFSPEFYLILGTL